MIKELLEAVEAKRTVNKSTVQAEFARALVGKKLKAFGPNGKGLYGKNPKEIAYKVDKVVCNYYANDDKFASIDVYLADYEARGRDRDGNKLEEGGLIYTDKVFIASLNKALKAAKVNYKYAGYSEYGMQGRDFVNLDVSI